MPGAPWSYLLLVVVVLLGATAWQFIARRRRTKKKAGPKAPAAPVGSDEQIAARLTGNALLLLQRLTVAPEKPKELQTLKAFLSQANDQAAQQALDLLTSNGCAEKVGTSQYRVTPRGERLWKTIQAKKRGGK